MSSERDRAESLLRLLSLIGDGDWTPQDLLGAQVARDVLSLTTEARSGGVSTERARAELERRFPGADAEAIISNAVESWQRSADNDGGKHLDFAALIAVALVERLEAAERERDAFREEEFDTRGVMLAMKARLRRAERGEHEHITVAEFRRDGAACALCGGGAYPPWLTDDETWRRVMGDSHEQVCLPCFFDRAMSSDPLHVSLGAGSAESVVVGLRELWKRRALAAEARAARYERELREVIGACAPPVESLLAVHSDGKYIAPTTVDGLREAATALRKAAATLSGQEEEGKA